MPLAVRPVLCVAILLWLAGGSALAQMSKADFKKNYAGANFLMEDKYYLQAEEVWLQLLAEQPDNANLNYRMGLCVLESHHEQAQSLKYFEKAILEMGKKYDMFNPSGKTAPYDAQFYLGFAHHLNYQLDQAIGEFETFMDLVPSKHSLYREAIREIQMCKNAKTLMANQKNFNIKNMGPIINSPAADFSPVVDLSEEAIYFTSRRTRPDSSNLKELDAHTNEHYEDIYVSYKGRDGNWTTPEELNFNTSGHEATISLSIDGQTLYIYKDDAGDGNIYFSKLRGEIWTTPEKLPEQINTRAWETHASASADGQTLYFTSNRDGGFGGRDIYRCVKLPNGEWSKALNLGSPINTPFDEEAPFLHPDGRSLYFSSKGHTSMGGFDIVYSHLGDDGLWSEPVNMGYPINSVDDDVFFVTSVDGRRAYFSSGTQNHLKTTNEFFGEKDIYMIDMPDNELSNLTVLRGHINVAEGRTLPESAMIYITNKATGEVVLAPPRTRDGAFFAILPACLEYTLDYQVYDKTFYTEIIDVPCESTYQEINKEVLLDPIPAHPDSVALIAQQEKKKDPVIMTAEPIPQEPIAQEPKPDPTPVVEAQPVVPVKVEPAETAKVEVKAPVVEKEPIKVEPVPVQPVVVESKPVPPAQVKPSNEIDPKNLRWRILYDGKPYKNAGVLVTYVRDDGGFLYAEQIDENGYFKYHGLDDDQDFIFNVLASEPGDCKKMEILLVDNKDNIYGKTERADKCIFNMKNEIIVKPKPGEFLATSKYSKFYKYNEKDIQVKEAEFRDFIEECIKIINIKGKVTVTIEGSASYVPTVTYKTNENLSNQRATDAKNRMLETLSSKGISADKVKFLAVNSTVQGPYYKDDFIENKAVYEKYQFVKIQAN